MGGTDGKGRGRREKMDRANAGQTWDQWWPNLLARTCQEEAVTMISHQHILGIPCQTFLPGKTNKIGS